jgi:hypothetical protein
VALLVLPVLDALLSSALLPPGETYNVGGGLPLLAIVGGSALAGYAGLLAARACANPEALLRAFSPSFVIHPPELAPGGRVRPDGAPPPVLPVLTSYFALHAGLGGRVEALR